MSLLLKLPLELRAQIIDLVIFHCREKPDLDTVCNWPRDGFRIAPEIYNSNTTALLQCNNQLHSETVNRLALNKTKATFELDIVITEDHPSFQTWLRLPAVTNDVEILNVTFRSLGENGNPDASGYGNSGSEWHNVWINETFETILKLGALSPVENVPHNTGYISDKSSCQSVVRNLNLIVESFVGTSTSSTMARSSMERSNDLTASSQPLPTTLDESLAQKSVEFANSICDWVSVLLEWADEVLWYGGNIYRNFGTIRVYVNGELIKEFDLGQSLIAYPGPGDAGIRYAALTFAKWRENTIMIRMSKGLPLPDTIRQSLSR